MEEKQEISEIQKPPGEELSDEFLADLDRMLLWIRDKMKPWIWYPENDVLSDKAIDIFWYIINNGWSSKIEFSADLNKVRKCENF